jgi:hypothetical protein
LTHALACDKFRVSSQIRGACWKGAYALASLQARSSIRRPGVLPLINRLMSVAVLVTLLSAGWVALSFLRAEMGRRPSFSGGEVKPREELSISNSSAESATGASSPSKASILVYSAAGDGDFYHNSSHLPARAERTALSEEAARSRGLKPCPVCLRR